MQIFNNQTHRAGPHGRNPGGRTERNILDKGDLAAGGGIGPIALGQRVQNSVFECLVDPAQWARLRSRLVGEIDPDLQRVGQNGGNAKR